uniref:Uncharacterized protein n=1 Tax=Arundo donax TaxID=35708 RepID=A0A0A9EPN5_ARUDO
MSHRRRIPNRRSLTAVWPLRGTPVLVLFLLQRKF